MVHFQIGDTDCVRVLNFKNSTSLYFIKGGVNLTSEQSKRFRDKDIIDAPFYLSIS